MAACVMDLFVLLAEKELGMVLESIQVTALTFEESERRRARLRNLYMLCGRVNYP